VLLFLAAGAAAGELDGAKAPPERWTHPHGPAAGNRRSAARVPDSFGGIRWSYTAKRQVLTPPLTWDGVAFLLDGPSLVALDIESGRVIARAGVKPTDPPALAAYNRSVFVLETSNRLVQLRLRGRQLVRGWSLDVGAGASAPCILDGEIYVRAAGGLLRLRAGARKPIWKTSGDYVGNPAAYGDHVYAVRRAGSSLELVAHARADGKVIASGDVGSKSTAQRVVITKKMAGIETTPGDWTIFQRKTVRGDPELTFSRNEKLLSQPCTGQSTFLGLTNGPMWVFLTMGKGKRQPLVHGKRRPELVDGVASPISLNWPTVCFGTWAGNVHSMRILWHLNERPEIKQFRAGVRFNAVPARNELLLIVPRDGKSLHAIGPEEIG